ncbi:MAG: hypothetical protein J6W04_02735, partial [Bacteroidales bacterium]|nr:hypothetical protein [Bacteroidales bacterium]
AEKEAERKAKAKKTSSSSSKKTTTRKKKSSFEKAIDSGMNTIGRELGKSIVRTILGVLKNK